MLGKMSTWVKDFWQVQCVCGLGVGCSTEDASCCCVQRSFAYTRAGYAVVHNDVCRFVVERCVCGIEDKDLLSELRSSTTF